MYSAKVRRRLGLMPVELDDARYGREIDQRAVERVGRDALRQRVRAQAAQPGGEILLARHRPVRSDRGEEG